MPETPADHFVLITAGTAGDMYPFMALAQAWLGLGRRTTMVGPAFHAEMVRRAGIPYLPIGTREGFMALIDDPDLWHPQKGLRVLMRDYRLRLGEIRQAIRQELPAGERLVILSHPMAVPAAAIVQADRPGTRLVGVCLAPSNLRSCHDPLTIGPMRVPPSQSATAAAARSSAWSGRRCSSSRVIRVRRVPKQNTSVRLEARLDVCANCTRLRE